MAKGSKRNKERAAAQENKARRVAKRNAPAPQPAAPKPQASSPAPKPQASSSTSETKPKKSLKKIRRQRNKKREDNAKKREANKADSLNIKADNKAAEKFNASFSIDGKSFAYRDPKNLENAQVGSRGDRGIQETEYNPNAYDYTDPLYQYSEGRVSDAARALGISNVNSKKEVNQILGQIRNPQSLDIQVQETDNGKKKKKSKKNNNQQLPAPAPAPEPDGPDPLQVMQDNFQSQLADLMSSMADYDQRFIEQRNNYQQDISDMRTTLSAQMNPQMRNPIFGVRTPGMLGRARNMNSSFGRTGSRLGGIRNNTLNLS